MPRSRAHELEKWAEVEYGVLPGFESTIEGDELVVNGECPRCYGQTTWRFRMGQMGAVDSKAVSDLAAESQPTTIVCACGYPHEDRPDDAHESGCGAFWRVLIPTLQQEAVEEET